MSEVVDPGGQTGHVPLGPQELEEAGSIAEELSAIAKSGRLLPGSLKQRLTRCGRANCACHADPPRRHGPYWHWTRKVAQKTVGRWLSAEQASSYLPWVENDRRAHELLARLEALGLAVLEADLEASSDNAARQPPVEEV
jgi:hypothetical protein